MLFLSKSLIVVIFRFDLLAATILITIQLMLLLIDRFGIVSTEHLRSLIIENFWRFVVYLVFRARFHGKHSRLLLSPLFLLDDRADDGARLNLRVTLNWNLGRLWWSLFWQSIILAHFKVVPRLGILMKLSVHPFLIFILDRLILFVFGCSLFELSYIVLIEFLKVFILFRTGYLTSVDAPSLSQGWLLSVSIHVRPFVLSILYIDSILMCPHLHF